MMKSNIFHGLKDLNDFIKPKFSSTDLKKKKFFKEIFMVFGYFDGHEKCFQTGPGVLLTQMNKTCQKSIID